MADEKIQSMEGVDYTAALVAADAAKELADASAARIAELETQLDAVTGERDGLLRDNHDLSGQRDTLQAQVDAAANAPSAQPVDAPRRKVAVMDNPTTLALRDAIQAAGSVQLAFSDGKRDIAGLRPMEISGDAWRVAVNGLALAMPNFIIAGPASGPVQLAGYALFADGEQIAWAQRSDVLQISPGQSVNLSNDVIFPG